MQKKIYIIVVNVLFAIAANAQMQLINQFMTAEDSLSNPIGGNISKKTYLGSYGEMKYDYNITLGEGQATLQRFVLFLGHRFNKKISFFSELELENATIEQKKFVGEISLEQVFLRFTINKELYLVGGLFLPRIGLMNENHLPTNYNSVDRPYVEQLIIPATWREIGIGLYGSPTRLPGFQYTFALMNGLDAGRFQNGSGLKEGRGLGALAPSKNLAITASLLYDYKGFRIQSSGYFGGGIGLNSRLADSLNINSGVFGSPIGLFEINASYTNHGIIAKILFSQFWIPNAAAVNRVFANNTPQEAWGAYGEIGYNIFYPIKKIKKDRSLVPFVRIEILDLNAKVPTNGIVTGINHHFYTTAGIAYQPIKPVVIKVNYIYTKTGEPNPDLIINPYPQMVPYFSTQHRFNIGLGYNF